VTRFVVPIDTIVGAHRLCAVGLIDSFILSNDNYKYCARPMCNFLIRTNTSDSSGKIAPLDVRCNCGFAFCFACQLLPHAPASCAIQKRFGEVQGNISRQLEHFKVRAYGLVRVNHAQHICLRFCWMILLIYCFVLANCRGKYEALSQVSDSMGQNWWLQPHDVPNVQIPVLFPVPSTVGKSWGKLLLL